MHNDLRRLTEQIVSAILTAARSNPQEKVTLCSQGFSIPVPRTPGSTRHPYNWPSLKFHGKLTWDPQQRGGRASNEYYLVGTLANLFQEKLGSNWALVNGARINWPNYSHDQHQLEFYSNGILYSGKLFLDGELEIG